MISTQEQDFLPTPAYSASITDATQSNRVARSEVQLGNGMAIQAEEIGVLPATRKHRLSAGRSGAPDRNVETGGKFGGCVLF
jgi:hypothetical protein